MSRTHIGFNKSTRKDSFQKLNTQQEIKSNDTRKLHWIIQPCKFGLSEGILSTEHQSRFKNFPSHQDGFQKKRVENPKNSVFGHFWKIVELNTNVLEPSLLSEINNWSLLYKMSLKLIMITCNLNLGDGVHVKRCKRKRNTLRRSLKINHLIPDFHSD